MARVAHMISEQDLHAYVDERLAPARRRAVETYLAQKSEARAIVENYRDQNRAMRALAVSSEPLPDPIRHLCLALSRCITQLSPDEWNKQPVKKVSVSPRR